MGIFTKYKTFFVEFLVLILFGWILMEYQIKDGGQIFERFDTEFLPREELDLVNYKTLFYKMNPELPGIQYLQQGIAIQNERFGQMYYKTTIYFGGPGSLEFVGYVNKTLYIWMTIRESFIEIKTNHQKDEKGNFSIPNVKDGKRINIPFGNLKTIQIQRNRRFIIG